MHTISPRVANGDFTNTAKDSILLQKNPILNESSNLPSTANFNVKMQEKLSRNQMELPYSVDFANLTSSYKTPKSIFHKNLQNRG